MVKVIVDERTGFGARNADRFIVPSRQSTRSRVDIERTVFT